MRLLYWAPQPGVYTGKLTGNGPHLRGVISALERHGCDVLTLFGGDLFQSRDAAGGTVPTRRVRKLLARYLPHSLRNDIRTVWTGRLASQAARRSAPPFRPDVIYERTAYLNGEGPKLAARVGAAYVLESDANVDMTVLEDGSRLAWWAKRLEASKHKHADAIVVSSRYAKRVTLERFHVDEDRIFVKELGVDVGYFDPNRVEREELRMKLELSDSVIVGYVGSFRKHHRVELLLEAARQLRRVNRPRIKFLLVGGEGNSTELRQLCLETGLDNVVFAGIVPEDQLPGYIGSMDIGVVPGVNRHILYPIKLIEYGAMKLGVVVPDHPAFEGVVENERSGLFFAEDSPSSLSEALVRMAKDASFRHQVSQTFHEHVRNHHTWDDVAQRMLQAVEVALRYRANEQGRSAHAQARPDTPS